MLMQWSALGLLPANRAFDQGKNLKPQNSNRWCYLFWMGALQNKTFTELSPNSDFVESWRNPLIEKSVHRALGE
jgi:hypothetical protein